MSPRSRIGTTILAAVVGFLVGLTGGFVQAHRSIWLFDGRYLVIPWGVIIVLVVLVIAIRGMAKVSGLRAAGWLVLAGWLAATVLLALESPSGDIAVSSGLRQWGYLLGGVIIGSMTATLPPRAFWGRSGQVTDSAPDHGNRSGDTDVTIS